MSRISYVFRRQWRQFRSQPWWVQAFLLLFFSVFWLYGGAKNGGGGNASESEGNVFLRVSSLSPHSVIFPGTTEETSSDVEYFRAFYLDRYSGLAFSGIDFHEDGVSLSIGWTRWIYDRPSSVDIYASTSLVSLAWTVITNCAFVADETNTLVTIPAAQIQSVGSRQMFFLSGSPNDLDGDGLSDDYELIISRTNPSAVDTDHDGLSDAREIELELSPLVYDSDGDGVPDGRELMSGSDPHSSDSDDDGLSDGQELGDVALLAEEDFLWFDMSSAVDLLAGTGAVDDACWNLQLPNPIRIAFEFCTNVVVCTDGMIHLANPDVEDEFQTVSIGEAISGQSLSLYSRTIAACNADLKADPVRWGSRLSYGSCLCGDGFCTVFEYRDFVYLVNGAALKITFQVILPADEANVVYVSYLESDLSFPSDSQVNGIQIASSYAAYPAPETVAVPYPACLPFPLTGKTFRYRFGTGTNVHRADSDNDGISDGNEVNEYHTDPVSWDSDGDGFSDSLEIANGWDPLTRGDYDGGHLPEGANVSAYYQIGVTATEADAFVDFAGDGHSDLADPVFQLHVGETNEVRLLIGKTYTVTSSVPIACTGTSDTNVVVDVLSDRSFRVVWPVLVELIEESGGLQFLMAPPPGAGTSFAFNVTPTNLNGRFSWDGGACCQVSGEGNEYEINCHGDCGCGGCVPVGTYSYEGFNTRVEGRVCGCAIDSSWHDLFSIEPDASENLADGGIAVEFSESAIIFEDKYVSPNGNREPRKSTVTKLQWQVYGGDNGGTYSIRIENEGKLNRVGGAELPVNKPISAGACHRFTAEYEAQEFSDEVGDVRGVATFTDQVTVARKSSNCNLTAIQVKIKACDDAPEDHYEVRHKYGVCEQIRCVVYPEQADLTWRTPSGGSMVDSTHYLCPTNAVENPLTAEAYGVQYTPSITVVEPHVGVVSPDSVSSASHIGEAGWAGLRFDLQLEPLDVCFKDLEVEERPCSEGTRTGYFSQPIFSHLSSHTVENGAGRWKEVDEDNLYAGDTAEITGPLPKIEVGRDATNVVVLGWTAGLIDWPIPTEWRLGNSPPVEINQNIRHRCEIDENGTVRISKFGWCAERTVNGVTNVYICGSN